MLWKEGHFGLQIIMIRYVVMKEELEDMVGPSQVHASFQERFAKS